tara:strand:+ start:326 stop:937 length:612 start_codon:yes stop_codon:yes gene_type:complete
MYKYNKNSLIFEKTYKLVKYRIIVAILSIFFASTLISAIKLKTEVLEKEQIIKQKQERIETIKQPLRNETYIQDLHKNIGFKLTEDQYKKFESLALKYRDKIERAKVPATLIWWLAYKESRFNKKAENNSSTAKGLFQFVDGTWNSMCKLNGTNIDGRFNEEKQVDVILTYLNYLYNKEKNWGKVMHRYHGGDYQYPITFLFK